MQTVAQTIISRHFNRATLKALASKGIRVLSSTFAPDASGSFLNGQTVYNVDDNGTGRVLSFLDVLKLSK